MMEARIAGKMGAVGVLPGRWSGGQGRQGAPVAAGGPTSQPGAIRLRHGPPGRKRVADSVVSQDECFTCVGVRRGDRGWPPASSALWRVASGTPATVWSSRDKLNSRDIKAATPRGVSPLRILIRDPAGGLLCDPQLDPVVRRVYQVLFCPKIPFRRLNGRVPEEQLNLLQFAARRPAHLRA